MRHLSKSVRPVARALGLPRLLLLVLFGRGRTASRPFVELRQTYLSLLAAGGTAGRFAPSPRAAPHDPEAWRATVMERWHAANAELRRQAARWSEADLDRRRMPHPLLGKLTVREMLFFTLYHNAHHLELVASRVGER